MSARREILYLTHRMPYPPDKGEKVRAWHVLQFLAARYDVHLASFVDRAEDWRWTDRLLGLCKSASFIPLPQFSARLRCFTGLLSGAALSDAYFSSQRMQHAVHALRHRPLAAEIAFSSVMARYICEPAPDRLRIVDFCDSDAEKWRHYASLASGPLRALYRREARKVEEWETHITQWADYCFAVTQEEAAIFNKRDGVGRRVLGFANGVDANYFDPAGKFDRAVDPCDVIFVGAMDYRANVNGVRFFAEAVWPKVRRTAPQATFYVLGARPAASIRKFDGINGVRVMGRVDDVRPWLAGAKLSIAPMRVAQGLQNKVLESLAMARPVVATSAAACGIGDGARQGVRIADSADEMAQAVIALLGDSAARAHLGAAGRSAIKAEYNWARRLDPLGAVLPDYDAF